MVYYLTAIIEQYNLDGWQNYSHQRESTKEHFNFCCFIIKSCAVECFAEQHVSEAHTVESDLPFPSPNSMLSTQTAWQQSHEVMYSYVLV